MNYVRLGDIQIWLETFGCQKNPTVLLIAGAMAPASFWTDAFCTQIANAGYFVIRYDHRDTGLSSSIEYEKKPYTLHDLVKEAIAILDAFEIKKAHIVGHSMGGMLALVLALHYPEKCLSVISISDGLLSNVLLSKDEKEGLEKTWKILLENKPTLHYEESVSGFLKSYKHLNGTLEFDGSMAKTYIKDMYTRSNHLYVTKDNQIKAFQIPHNHVRAQETSKINKESISKITVPTFIIHGEKDYIVLPVYAKKTAQAIPNASLTIIPGMGHMLFNRDLKNKIIQLVLGFIQKN